MWITHAHTRDSNLIPAKVNLRKNVQVQTAKVRTNRQLSYERNLYLCTIFDHLNKSLSPEHQPTLHFPAKETCLQWL